MDDVVCFVGRSCVIGGEPVRAGEFVNINARTGAVTICRKPHESAALMDLLASGHLTVLRGDVTAVLSSAQHSAPRAPSPRHLALLR